LVILLIPFSLAADIPLRLSALEGNAAVKHPDSDEWAPLEPNFPLAEGDRLVVQAGSRLEMEVGIRAIVRLDAGADLAVESVRPLRLALYQGSAIIRTGAQEAFFVTPSSEVRLLPNGRYRIDVNDSAAQATVFKGTADIGGAQYQSGSTLLLQSGGGVSSGATVLRADPFQLWSERRDSGYAFEKSTEYLPSGAVAGVSELDSNGTWSYSSLYGNVWYPSVNIGWSPYRSGHWYCSPIYGWTWISREPWGWLPYHYGAWTLTSRGWCWVPGNAAFTGWSPALVHFLRSDYFIGWFPLGPGDRVSAGISSLRRTWGAAPVFANWGVPGGLMFLPIHSFVRGEGPLPGVVAADWNLGNGQIVPNLSDIRPQAGLWTNRTNGPASGRSGTLWGYSQPNGINPAVNRNYQYPGNRPWDAPAAGGAVIPQQGGSRIPIPQQNGSRVVVPQEGGSRIVVPRREIPSSSDRPPLVSQPRSSGGSIWGRTFSGIGLWGSSRGSGSTSDSSSRRRP